MLAIVGALIVGASFFYLNYTLQVASQTDAAKERLGINWGSDEKAFVPPIYLKLTRPLLKGGTLEIAVGFWKPEQLDVWKKKIRAAGLQREIEPEHVVAAKFWLTLIIAGFLFLRYLFSSDPGSPVVPVIVSLVAFFYPNIHLNGLRETRQNEIRLGMPYVMDLMTLSMEAGLEFQGAITRVVERAPRGPFIEELAELLKDIQLGKSRAEALRKMAVAVDIPEITSLVAVLVSTDQMGSPVGPVLRAQGESLRVERLVKAEKLGAQAGQKILVPLVFLILPAVMLMIFGPLILQMLGVK